MKIELRWHRFIHSYRTFFGNTRRRKSNKATLQYRYKYQGEYDFEWTDWQNVPFVEVELPEKPENNS